MLTRLLLTLDAVVCGVISLFIFFQPHVVGDFVFNRETDGVHWHLIRCVGAQLLAGSYISFRFRNQSTETHTACHLLKIMSSMLTMLMCFQSRSMTPELINLKYIQAVIYLSAATFILHLVFLLGSKWPIGSLFGTLSEEKNLLFGSPAYRYLKNTGSWCIAVGALTHWVVLVILLETGRKVRPAVNLPFPDYLGILFIRMNGLPNNRIGDSLYQLDALTCIAVGAAWITFPNWLLHRQVIVDLDDSHALCGRMMGVLFISSYLVSSHALHWINREHRFVAVSSRVVCCAGILSAQLWSQHAYHRDWSDNHWVGITLFSTWTVISLIYSSYLFFSTRTSEKKSKRT